MNELETAIQNGMAGVGATADLMAHFLEAKIWVPSAQEVQSDGTGLAPLLLESRMANNQMIVVFTDINHIGPGETQQAPYVLEVSGQWLVKSLAPDLGIIVFANPGSGCEISISQLNATRRLIQDYG